MRIIVVSQSYWPSLGGAEVMLDRLTRTWAKLGEDVIVLTHQSEKATDAVSEHAGVTIRRDRYLPIRFLGTIDYIRRLRKSLRELARPDDVIYVSMLKHASYAAVTAFDQRQSRPKIVLRAEGAGATGDVAWQSSALFGRRIKKVCQRAGAIIAPGPAILDELVAAGYSRDHVHLLCNGVAIPKEPWSKAECSAWRGRLGLENLPTLVYTGRLHLKKGLTWLATELTRSSHENRHMQFLLVGDGPERSTLESLKSHLSDRVKLVLAGQVDDVENYLRAADMLVLPSEEEGLSVSLLESLAMGMPALASDIPANRSIAPRELLSLNRLHDGEMWRRSISELLGKPQADAEIQSRRNFVMDHFSLDAVAQKHLQLFRQI